MTPCRRRPTVQLWLAWGVWAGIAAAAALSAQAGQPEPIAPLGGLVDAGGHRIHLRCTGEGAPTVILETGGGDFSFVWALVQPDVAKFTRVCSYDRAGYAWSEAGPKPRTMAQIVYELHTGLASAGITGPYVFVGASFGGLISRIFASTYPSDLSGIVLVDGAQESGFIMLNNKWIRFRETSQGRSIPPVQKHWTEAGGEPTERLVFASEAKGLDAGDPRSKLPEELQRIWSAAQAQKKYAEARQSEFAFLGEELAALYQYTQANPQPLGSKPLIVLTRETARYPQIENMTIEDLKADRKRLLNEHAGLSSNSGVVIVKDSRHEIHLDKPEVVVAAIRDVVEAARAGSRLK
jgi:pimeloyl-ACP methyl ester carboxylesterase